MSKKRFTDGLESLFGNPTEQGNLPDESPLLVETEVKEKPIAARKKNKKGRSGKNFMSDLDSLLEDALNDAVEDQLQQRRAKNSTTTAAPRKAKAPRKRTRKPVTGLDALIRQTIETSEIEVNYNTRKRVTFAFDKDKLAKLKKIAKIEQSYLKDILGDVVSEYIDKYEQRKGNLN